MWAFAIVVSGGMEGGRGAFVAMASSRLDVRGHDEMRCRRDGSVGGWYR